MSTALRNTLIVIGVLVAGAALVLVGVYLGRADLDNWSVAWMHRFSDPREPGGYWEGHPMMAIPDDRSGLVPYGSMMGSGMMGMIMGSGSMGPGMMGADMMGPYTDSGLYPLEPLSLEDTQTAVERYLAIYDDQDLAIGEIMIFENHAYAQIVEESTGFGAFEVLVDPVTLAVTPEPGPNMMWNLKYGSMGMMGNRGFEDVQGMMGGIDTQVEPEAMTVTLEDAIVSAQRYLDAYLPGTEADDHADPFYGYYTLHVLRDGEVIGMLSVNGFSNAVFLHGWHGDLLEIAELD